MTGEALLQAVDISRDYGDRRVVDGLSMTVRRGEALGFLGPNGAGKTTTLQMLAGVLATHAGRIAIDGIDLRAQPRQAKARLGYLPEAPPLNRELEVREYLDICARLHRIARPRLRSAVDRVLELCDLGAVRRRLIGNLSKGVQQRLGIAQAIIHEPPLIILDEPTVGLDPLQIRDIRALVRGLAADHGVVLSTHILPEVTAVCSRVAIIAAGRIVLDEPVGAGGRERTLRLRLRRGPDPAALAAIDGLKECAESAPGEWLLSHDGDPGFAERVAALAVAGDWGLLELSPASDTLEARFLRLTYGREAETPA